MLFTPNSTAVEFYANPRVWHSKYVDVASYRREFTVPENASVIRGYYTDIPQLLEQQLDESSVQTLVIRLEPTADLQLKLDLNHIQNMQALEELWIIGSEEPNYSFAFDASKSTSHVPLRRLHINVRARCFSDGMLRFISPFMHSIF